MKIIVNCESDSIASACSNDCITIPYDCYVVNVKDISDKFIAKGFWRELKDENNNSIWEDSDNTGVLKPAKGFVLSGETKVKFKNYPNLWTLDEVLKEKYDRKLKENNMKKVIFEEFIDFKPVAGLNSGKKFCNGSGVIYHTLKSKAKEIIIEIECQNLPTMFVSSNNEDWEQIDSTKFLYKCGKDCKTLYLKIDDFVNSLNAYSIYYGL